MPALRITNMRRIGERDYADLIGDHGGGEPERHSPGTAGAVAAPAGKGGSGRAGRTLPSDAGVGLRPGPVFSEARP